MTSDIMTLICFLAYTNLALFFALFSSLFPDLFFLFGSEHEGHGWGWGLSHRGV